MVRISYKILIALFLVAGVWFAVPSDDAHSFSAGAPPGYCDAPASPGSTCFTCHNDGPAPISIPGLITSNIPVSGYTPGNTYTITATITGVGHDRFGFEVSPQDSNGNLVGSMSDLGTETMFQQSGVYITHSSNSVLNADFKSWQFEWIAPAAGSGAVTFYGAFNITNNDGSYTGDTIVLSTATFPEDSGLYVSEQGNPFANTVAFTSAGKLFVRGVAAETKHIVLTDYSGKICWESGDIYSESYQSEVQFELPASLATGIYVVTLESGTRTWSTKIININ